MTNNEYINLVAPIIQEENQKRGNPLFSSVVIAQSILETGWGKSSLMMKANAIFGIKAFSDWKGKVYSAYTNEVYDNYNITIKASFRAYNDIKESVRDYFDLICNSERYRKALASETPLQCITEIKNGGYATDPEYIFKIMSIINTNKLTIYDVENVDNSIDNYYKIGHNYTTTVALNVRAGAGIYYGIKRYDDLTPNGKIHAYKQHNAVLKPNTIVTVLETFKVNSDIWLRIPSGFIAGYYGGKYYVR